MLWRGPPLDLETSKKLGLDRVTLLLFVLKRKFYFQFVSLTCRFLKLKRLETFLILIGKFRKNPKFRRL